MTATCTDRPVRSLVRSLVPPALRPARSGSRPALGRLLLRALTLVRQRRALARLDATRLADIGLTASQARAEAARPFWDAPEYWRAGR